MTQEAMRRGAYNEIIKSTIDAETMRAINSLVDAAASASKIDEHGSWAFGAEFNRRGRGSSLNWDVYGFGNDVHTGSLLAVIQIRQFVRTRYTQVRKNYFLVGTNEDGTVFAHSVSHAPIFAAIRKGHDVLVAVQNWIFGGDYSAMLRHGDLAVIPLKSRPAGSKGQLRKVAVLEGSHRLQARQIAEVGGRIYANCPSLQHIPGTHPDVKADGWCRIIVGKRADFWQFAAPTVD